MPNSQRLHDPRSLKLLTNLIMPYPQRLASGTAQFSDGTGSPGQVGFMGKGWFAQAANLPLQSIATMGRYLVEPISCPKDGILKGVGVPCRP